jgi:hypothetical protein
MEPTSVVCLVHTDVEMRKDSFTSFFPDGRKNEFGKRDGHVCTVADCRINFSDESGVGYFRLNEDLKINPVLLKGDKNSLNRKCDSKDHKLPRWMFLTKIDGVLKWACPESGCDRTKPFN